MKDLNNEDNEIWVAIGPEEIKAFERIINRVEHTNIFPIILQNDNFEKIEEDTYSKGENQLIKVFNKQNKWQYINLKDETDFGSAIQFIANRWSNESPLAEKSMAIVFAAASVADKYYRNYVKQFKKEFLAGSAKTIATERRRRFKPSGLKG